MQQEPGTLRIAIVGGGLVGSLAASTLKQRLKNVDITIFEKQQKTPENSGRSINLALSERGLSAIKFLNLDLDIVPMHSRLLHLSNGSLMSQRYGYFNQFISSVDRNQLNRLLLEKAILGCQVLYSHTLVDADLDQGTMIFEVEGLLKKYSADLIIGCDGVYSKVLLINLGTYQNHA